MWVSVCAYEVREVDDESRFDRDDDFLPILGKDAVKRIDDVAVGRVGALQPGNRRWATLLHEE